MYEVLVFEIYQYYTWGILGVQLMLHTHTHGFPRKVPKNVGIWSPPKNDLVKINPLSSLELHFQAKPRIIYNVMYNCIYIYSIIC